MKNAKELITFNVIMKKTLSIILIFSCLTTIAQQLPNPDFENWGDSHTAEGWNIIDVFGTYYSGEQTSDAAYGISAVKLETQSILGQMMPGVILLGDINMETFMPEGGVEFAGRPTGISFHYKCNPMPNDSMLMLLMLTKWNTETNSRDTIAGTFFTQAEEITDYTKKTLPIIYASIEEPDTINVGFVSSGMTPVAGSTLFIDSITMEYGFLNLPTICLPATNDDMQNFTANWLPIPNATSYYLDIAYDQDFTTYLPDYENKILVELFFETTHDISNIEPNLYYYRVRVGYLLETSENSNIIKIAMTTEASDASNITYNSFTANWLEVSAATGYQLEVATNESFENIIVNEEVGIQTNYEVTDLTENTEYFYRVRVIYNDGEGVSRNSNIVPLTTDNNVFINGMNKDNFVVFGENKNIIIKNKEYQNAIISIYNYTGKLITETSLTNTTTKIPVNQTGIYIVNIKTAEQNITKKVFLD